MPVIIPPESYDRWLSTLDPDPRDLLVPYPAGPMRIWPISTRVNKPANDDAALLEPVKPTFLGRRNILCAAELLACRRV